MTHSLILPIAAATFSLRQVDNLDHSIEVAIGRSTGESFQLAGTTSMGGGCINEAACATGRDGRKYFLKLNDGSMLRPFEAEATALRVMAQTHTIRVPNPVAVCQAGNRCALILELLPLGSRGGDWAQLGRSLAAMHRHTAGRFGWEEDNWIGSFPQKNSWRDSWVAFYADCRLSPQFKAARERGLRLGNAEQLLESLPAFFESYDPPASLLHGDLWAGNAGFLEDDSPVVFDPASYYGDRETDLAMTEMFGGYDREFYRAYNEQWPLDAGYRVRKPLYILYHALNHFNLFGGGYGSQAESLINGLLSNL